MTALSEFADLLRDSVERHDVAQLVLANYRGAEPGLQRVIARQLELRGQPMLSLLYRYTTRDITKNFAPAAGIAELLGLLDGAAARGFGHAHLRTAEASVDLRISKKGRPALSRNVLPTRPSDDATASDTAASAAVDGLPTTAHDRTKHRLLTLDAAYWSDLGITDQQGRLIPSMSRKWKQINRFLEVLDAAWRESSLARRASTGAPLRVLDFGAGKGYLSFAVAAHLTGTLGVAADVVGVELRADLVDLCNSSIERRRLPGIHFEQGDVMSHPVGAIDIMIALHACDTATDHAIHKGISAGAQIILCSPCCHKQLRPQLRSPGLLQPMLQHGIHLGQQAEMITDSLRALLLEAHGYRTQVFEFVALEHTSKNKMILAVRRDAPAPADEVYAQIRRIKDFYGVREHCLERLLGDAGGPASDAAASPAR